MKALFLNMFLFAAVVSFGQPKRTSGLPGLGNIEVKSTDGKILNANALKTNQSIILTLPVFNFDLLKTVKATNSISINFGTKVKFDNNFDLSKAALSEYFAWTVSNSKDGELLVTGKLIKDLPARFNGNATFALQSAAGRSTIKSQWLVPDQAEKDRQVSTINIKSE